jgi:hypothetical protein
MTITEFLLARIAEDEAHAQSARDWVTNGPDPRFIWFGSPGEIVGARFGAAEPHVAAMSPARVLAECAAKRAIIEQAQNATEAEKEFDDYEWQGTVSRSEPWTGDAILYALAAVYASHPDYLPEWAL